MRRSFTRPTAWFVWAVFSAASLLGYGFHFAPGSLHGCAHPAEASAGSHAHDGHVHHVTSGEERDTFALGCDDCPICRYLAQSRQSVPSAAAGGIEVALTPLAAIQPPLVVTDRGSPFPARGPPQISFAPAA